MSGEFMVTIGDAKQFPALFNGQFLMGREDPRVAFVGRSNVGKSSLINALMEARLAQVSAEPGKTRKLHLYHWKQAGKILVDLPGYGFAKSAKTDRDSWARLIQAYLKADENILGVLLLWDSRVGPTDKDLEAWQFFQTEGIAARIAFTKCDQLKTQSERAKRKKEAEKALSELGIEPDEVFWVSARDKDLGFKKLVRWVQTV